jgi:phosphoribosylaminoimidazolecarboxamide formyltransferase/IMP cyclohydrolase
MLPHIDIDRPLAMTDALMPRRALLSVSDKGGLIQLAGMLERHGIEMISTGGTAAALRDAGFDVTEVQDVTQWPAMLSGRVKTLHPAVHGGLLARRDDPEHVAQIDAQGIAPIDLVVVNLYPFDLTVASGAGFEVCIEQIDIGGPALLRSAAKNHAHVAVVTDAEDYADLCAALENGGTTPAFRRRLALAAFSRVAAYDAAISRWLADETGETPRNRTISGRLLQKLSYGENPHQTAAFYASGDRPGVNSATQVQGRELSYNNISDTDAALEAVAEHGDPACVIVKHGNPCGAAVGDTPLHAYQAAFDCDRTSAFGGIVALNRPVDRATAEAITQIFTEVVIAPGADADARRVFSGRPNLRLLTLETLPDPRLPWMTARSVSGGLLVQEGDAGMVDAADLRTVTRRAPTEVELADLLFAWRIVKHAKSNAIVYARGRATVGIGAGQTSRVDAVRIAARKAWDMHSELGLPETPTRGAVIASDAFFPFADGVEVAARAGATAIIQPGGSLRDDEVVAAADAAGLAMVLTGMRHFRH